MIIDNLQHNKQVNFLGPVVTLKKHYSDQGGFTFMELIILLVLICVLATIAVPSFLKLLEQERALATLRSLKHSLELAKSHAINSGQVITVCASINQLQCDDDWTHGWMVFMDNNNNQVVDDDEPILEVAPAIHANDKLTWQSFNQKTFIQFEALGLMAHRANGTFRYCPNHQNQTAKALIINRLGRTRYSHDMNSDGFDEVGNETKIQC